MIGTRLLLLPLALLSTINAYRGATKDTRRGVRWLEKSRSVFVRLDTPEYSGSTSLERL